MEKFNPSRGEHVNPAYDPALDEPPVYNDTFSNGEQRTVRPSVVSAFGHDTLDRVPNIDFYRNAGSVSGQRAVRPSLQELHDVFQKVSGPGWQCVTYLFACSTVKGGECYFLKETVYTPMLIAFY